MAKVLGKAGGYVEKQTIKKSQQFVLWCLIGACVCCGIAGFLLAKSFRILMVPPWLSLPFLLLTIGLVYFGNRMLQKKTDALERDRLSFRKGAVGEHLIAGILEGLPDDYVVMNDLTTPNGNFDHVVVGPNGIFAIDTKNWKGIVEADGNGGLLLNGKPTTKSEAKNLVRTVMSTRDRIKAVCRQEYFIKAVLAFPIARVEAKWGSVKNADCVTDESLNEYIIRNKTGTNLDAQEIDRVSRAFQGLAKMDSEVQRQS